MTIIYDVHVICTQGSTVRDCGEIRVAAHEPILACEAAERIMAANYHGTDGYLWLDTYFADHVKPLTCAELLNWTEAPSL